MVKAGRPRKYETKEEALNAKRIQTLISNKKKIGGKISMNDVIKTVKKGFNKEIAKPTEKLINKAGKDINKTASAVGEYVNAIFQGRNDYPPKVRDILKKVGDKYVKSITIGRTPVSGLLTGALDVFSLGKFKRRMEKNFDELFHLFIIMTLEDGQKVLLEKNEVINMDLSPSKKSDQESKEVINVPYETINVMLDNTKKYMGKKYFDYDASNNNCQDFIVAFFKSNNIGDESDITFIKQNTKQLFNKLPALKKIAKATTDLGATVNVVTEGKGVDDVKNYGMLLNHLTEHITDPNESIDPKDYIQSQKLIKAILKEKKDLKGGRIKKISHNNISMSGGDLNEKHLIIHHYVHYVDSDSDSDCDEIEGGKININKEIKKVGKKISKEVSKPINNVVIPNVNDATDKTKKYVTSKKGGLATDLINYGVPAATGALVAAPLTLMGGPLAGVVGSASGAKLGKEVIVPILHKQTGAGFKKGSKEAHQHMEKMRALKKNNKKELKEEVKKGGRFVKGSKEAKEWMEKIRSMKKN